MSTQGALETAQQHEEQLGNTVSEFKILIDQLENEKTRASHDAANLREKLQQSEGKSSEVNHKYKEQVNHFTISIRQWFGLASNSPSNLKRISE